VVPEANLLACCQLVLVLSQIFDAFDALAQQFLCLGSS
jgi:hypothetical protein